MTEKYNDVAALVIFGLVILFGLYGFVLDIFHGHLGWAIADVFSSGIIAVIRGVGYFFGFISY